ncbi:hypothetical protein GBAR_LOCUS8857, partial [Geodia barretti]
VLSAINTEGELPATHLYPARYIPQSLHNTAGSQAVHREELTGIQETIEVHTVEPFSEKDTSPIRTHFFPQKFLQDTSLIWTLSSVAL